MMAGPFVSKHLVSDDVRLFPLFSNFCEHFVSMNPKKWILKTTPDFRWLQAESNKYDSHMLSLAQ
jgi:hypothetical protein